MWWNRADVRVNVLGVAGAMVVGAGAFATVTPGTVFGDSYIVTDGTKTYSVLDVYIKTSTTKDIIASLFGVSAYPSNYKLNNGKAFQQSNGTATSSWLPTNDDGKAWDSYVTNGARVQGSDSTLAGGKAGFLSMQLDTNWGSSSSGSQIVPAAGSGGPGWFPGVGASSSTNPYARSGYNGGTSSTAGYWNTAKAATTIAGNGITVGQSLNNHWMIGRFAIDVTGDTATNNTLTMVFAVAGRNFATEASTSFTTFTGATSTAGRFSYTLNFAANPGCGWPACPSDLDGNRVVDTADVGLTLLDFGSCASCATDVDRNGIVDMADVALLLLDFGGCPPCTCPWWQPCP